VLYVQRKIFDTEGVKILQLAAGAILLVACVGDILLKEIKAQAIAVSLVNLELVVFAAAESRGLLVIFDNCHEGHLPLALDVDLVEMHGGTFRKSLTAARIVGHGGARLLRVSV
jgi:hypothetical protein